MKITNLLSSFARKLRRSAGMATGVVVLAGGMMFAGTAAAGVIISEDFEDPGPGAWSGGFTQYGTGANFSDSPHSGVPFGGDFYGWDPGEVVPQTATQPFDLQPGNTTIGFDGWLAAYTADPERTVFRAEFFSGGGGTGANLGEIILASGFGLTVADGVAKSVDSSGALIPGDVAATEFNWKHYVTTNPIPAGARSVIIKYNSETPEGTISGNDAYADNILITTDGDLVPEPTTLALLGLGGLAIAGLRIRK